MRSSIKTPIIGAMLALMSLSLSCATLQAAGPPQLELRTLRFKADAPALEYAYEVCVRTFLGICTKHEMKRETWDLTDPAVRAQLIAIGFVAKVREKPLP